MDIKMEEIEVGEYVRIYGILGKITKKENDNWYKWKKQGNIYNSNIKIDECREVKHSKQLIDLIEVGDIVNGKEVLDIYEPKDLWEPIEIRVDSRYENFILADDIKTILTKEQFVANCYKVGGEDE